MKILITEAVELAFNAFFNVLGNDSFSFHFGISVGIKFPSGVNLRMT